MIHDYQVNAALAVWPTTVENDRKYMRRALEAAQAAKPEPEIVVTDEMLDVACAEDARLAKGLNGGRLIYFSSIYRAMHAASPKEAPVEAACAAGVSDEAVEVACKAAFEMWFSGAKWEKCDAHMIPRWRAEIAAALTAALPYLTGHTGVAAACAAEGSAHEHTWTKVLGEGGAAAGNVSSTTVGFTCTCGAKRKVTETIILPTGHKAREAPPLFDKYQLKYECGCEQMIWYPGKRKGERRTGRPWPTPHRFPWEQRGDGGRQYGSDRRRSRGGE